MAGDGRRHRDRCKCSGDCEASHERTHIDTERIAMGPAFSTTIVLRLLWRCVAEVLLWAKTWSRMVIPSCARYIYIYNC